MMKKGRLVQGLQIQFRNILSSIHNLQKYASLYTMQQLDCMQENSRLHTLQAQCLHLASVLQDPQRHNR